MKRNKTLIILLLLLQGILHGQSVEDLIEQAIAYNPGLKALRLEYNAANLKADQVNDWPDPTLNLGIGVLPIETRLGAQRLRVGVSQMIPWKGMLGARSNVASARAAIKSHQDEVKEIEIEYQIRSAYAQLQYLHRRQAVLAKKLSVLDALEEMATSAVRAGNGKLSNALFVERNRQSLEADLKLLTQKMEQPTISINRWTGRPPNEDIVLVDDKDYILSKKEIIENATTTHPAFAILEEQVAASQARTALTRYESKPKIGVGLEYALINARNDVDISQNGRDVLMPMGSITLPLHTGRYEAIRQEEQLNQLAIKAYRIEIMDAHKSEIALAYANIQYADQMIEKFESLRQITQETLTLMRTEYASEGTRFEELLRLEMEMIDYDLQQLEANFEKALALAVLNKFY